MPVIKPTRKDQWSNRLDAIIELAQSLKNEGWALFEKDKRIRKDGYPTSSVPEAHSAGGEPARPTENAAISGMAAADLVREASEEMAAAVANALGALRAAAWKTTKALALDPLPAVDANPGCENCGRHGVWTVVYRAGRCEACWWFRDRNDLERPKDLVRNERVAGAPRATPAQDAARAAFVAAQNRRKAS